MKWRPEPTRKTKVVGRVVVLFAVATLIALPASYLAKGYYDDLFNLGWLDAYLIGVAIICFLLVFIEGIVYISRKKR